MITTTAVTLTDDTLVLTLPEITYNNGWDYCVRIGQAIPTVTSTIPAVIQIGTTQYPFRQKGGNNVYGNQLVERGSYIVRVAADTKQFILMRGWVQALNLGNTAVLA